MNSSSPGSPKTGSPASLVLRTLAEGDRAALEAIVRATEAFSEAEVAVALELIDAPRSEGYQFLVAELGGRVVGYVCYGETGDELSSWDLYWIAVDPKLQRSGIGHTLLEATELEIGRAGGRRVVIETGGKPSYARTRAFYERHGYQEIARSANFYAIGDDKVVYACDLARPDQAR